MRLTDLHRLLIATPFYLAALLILFIPMAPGVAVFSLFDMYVHVGMFFVLGAITFFLYPASVKYSAWGLVAFGAFSELLQSLTTTRTTDMADLFHDCIGIAMALSLFALFKPSFSQHTKASVPSTVPKGYRGKRRSKTRR